jgi:hypothetical protein
MPTPSVEDPQPRAARLLWWLGVALIAVGAAGRLLRYFLKFPIWGDEAFVCVNFVERDYIGLTRQLECCQVAPLLFLWGELTVVRLLGVSEFAVRLLPLLAGLLSLGLVWRLARSTVSPLAATLAVGLLAVARWPVSMSTFAKPYSFDLLMSLILLVPAVEWLRRPDRLVWMALLVLATPVAVLASYPAVFVAGAVSLALLPAAWRAGWAARGLFVVCNLLMVAAFLGSYWVVGREQLDKSQGLVNAYLLDYWADAFPPASPGRFAKWLVLTHTGRMMAYPFGDSNGGSTLTFLLFAAGVWSWWKSGRRTLLVLALVPFALNLFAAIIHRYPYGGCCRLSQHLAPASCLLAGTGAAALLDRFIADTVRTKWAVTLCGLLALCAVGGMVFDVVRPYRDKDAIWMRDMANTVRATAASDDQIVVPQTGWDVQAVFRWYLENQDERVRFNGQVDWDRLEASGGRLWVVTFWVNYKGNNPDGPPPFQAPAAHGWTLAEHLSHTSRKQSEKEDSTLHCELFHWIPPEARQAAAH